MAQTPNQYKPAKMMIVMNTAIEGKHLEAGTVVNDMPADVAIDLVHQNKARVATDEVIAEYKERAKQKAAADKAKLEAEQQAAANAVGGAEALANVIASAIAQALAAKTAAPNA